MGREIRTVTVSVVVKVDVGSYVDAYGDADDIASYTEDTVKAAAAHALKRVGWGTVDGYGDDAP